MAELMEVYNSVKSPLDNDALLKRILKDYQNSTRRYFVGKGKTGAGIYDQIISLGDAEDETVINEKDKQKFYIDIYNVWRENVLNLSAEEIENLNSIGRRQYNKLQELLMKTKPLKVANDMVKYQKNEFVSKKIWEVEDQKWIEVKSREISVYQESSVEIQHILYLALKNRDVFYFADLFVKKCMKMRVPYYFKISKKKSRQDKIVIYANIENLGYYIDILREIAVENPEIVDRASYPPVLVGRIDGWIGIGDEPTEKNFKVRTYYGVRSELVEDGIEKELLSKIEFFKGKKVIYKDNIVTFNSLFLNTCKDYLMEKIEYQKSRMIFEDVMLFRKEFGITEDEVGSVKLSNHILKGLKNNIEDGIGKLKSVENVKNTMLSENSVPVFKIETRNGRGIDVSINDLDKMIKRMIPVLLELDVNFIGEIRDSIKEETKNEEIDIEKFVFSSNTEEKFEITDKSKAMLEGIQKPKKIKVKKEEVFEEESDFKDEDDETELKEDNQVESNIKSAKVVNIKEKEEKSSKKLFKDFKLKEKNKPQKIEIVEEEKEIPIEVDLEEEKKQAEINRLQDLIEESKKLEQTRNDLRSQLKRIRKFMADRYNKVES